MRCNAGFPCPFCATVWARICSVLVPILVDPPFPRSLRFATYVVLAPVLELSWGRQLSSRFARRVAFIIHTKHIYSDYKANKSIKVHSPLIGGWGPITALLVSDWTEARVGSALSLETHVCVCRSALHVQCRPASHVQCIHASHVQVHTRVACIDAYTRRMYRCVHAFSETRVSRRVFPRVPASRGRGPGV